MNEKSRCVVCNKIVSNFEGYSQGEKVVHLSCFHQGEPSLIEPSVHTINYEQKKAAYDKAMHDRGVEVFGE